MCEIYFILSVDTIFHSLKKRDKVLDFLHSVTLFYCFDESSLSERLSYIPFNYLFFT